LGGRTKTSIIATVSPAAVNLEETVSTLDFAHRAMDIKKSREKNCVQEMNGQIEMLSQEIKVLKKEKDKLEEMFEDISNKLQEKNEELESIKHTLSCTRTGLHKTANEKFSKYKE
jgi:kinesin family protein 11